MLVFCSWLYLNFQEVYGRYPSTCSIEWLTNSNTNQDQYSDMYISLKLFKRYEQHVNWNKLPRSKLGTYRIMNIAMHMIVHYTALPSSSSLRPYGMFKWAWGVSLRRCVNIIIWVSSFLKVMCKVGPPMSKIEYEIEAYKSRWNQAKELGVVIETHAEKRSTL